MKGLVQLVDIQTGIISVQVVNATGASHDLFYNTSTKVCDTVSAKNDDS